MKLHTLNNFTYKVTNREKCENQKAKSKIIHIVELLSLTTKVNNT